MTKLNWSRAKQWVFDHAHYVPPRDDFVTPDPTVVSGGKKQQSPLPAALQAVLRERKQAAKERKQKQASEHARRMRMKAAKRAAKLEHKRLIHEQQAQAKVRMAQKAEAKRIKEVNKKAALEAHQVAMAEYQKTPEYIAKMERKAAEMAAKKKTHREAWAEQQTGLKEDRATLNQGWRARLLGKRSG